MALAKENSDDSNTKENFVDSSRKPHSQRANPLDGLLNLLIDLSLTNQDSNPTLESQAARDEKARLVEDLPNPQAKSQLPNETDNKSPESAILADTHYKEVFVSFSSQPNAQPIVPNGSPDEEVKRWGKGEVGEVVTSQSIALPPDQLASCNSCTHPVAPLDNLLDLLVDLQAVNHIEQSPGQALPLTEEETGVLAGLPKQQAMCQKLEAPHEQFPSQVISDENRKETHSQTVSPTGSLIDLLVDLQSINPAKQLSQEVQPLKKEEAAVIIESWPKELQTHPLIDDSEHHFEQPPLESLSLKEEEVGVAEDSDNIPQVISQELGEQVEAPTEDSISPDASLPDNRNNSESPLERLRTLLLTPELADTQQVILNIEQKLAGLEHQIYEQPELIDLLLPLITELLSRKIAESKEEVVEAIAPIIDQMIQSRAEQDKAAMSSALGPVISTAITHQISNAREEITTALGPAMAGAIKEQIVVEREAMVDALYPVIGSTISKYMVEEIRAINEKVENAMSVEGISRKLRAKMQGVSEAELLLKEAMPLTVQAIFLIHQGSGLVISEIQPSESQRLESEMVAGMLTAIRIFVNDCIAQSGTISELNQIEYGNSKIVLEVAGYCYLAVVVQGEPPQRFIRKLQQTLSTIIQNYSKPIELFDGDPGTIPEQVQQILKGLMETPSKPKQKPGKPPALLLVGSVLLGFILLPWGIYQYRSSINHRIEAETAFALASAPELAVYRLNADARDGTLKLSGKLPNQYLRQRAEQIAQGAAPTWKLNNSIIAVAVPPDPVLTAAEVKRVTTIMNQRDGVAISVRYSEGKVTVEGTVKQDSDAEKITQAFDQIPGVFSVTNTVQPKPFRIATRIYFEPGLAKLKPGETDKIVQIQAFLNRYPGKSINIVGHSDPSGDRLQNERLARERAEVVRAALLDRGVNPGSLQVQGTASPPLDINDNQPLWLSRCVEFEIITTNTKNQ